MRKIAGDKPSTYVAASVAEVQQELPLMDSSASMPVSAAVLPRASLLGQLHLHTKRLAARLALTLDPSRR
ncbi:hypothetical protein D3C84_1187710 [compost metagenome]